MGKIYCLNKISTIGTEKFSSKYRMTDNFEEAEGVLVRSASMHDKKMPESLLAIARAGAGVNNIPLEACATQGIVVFNTPGANANAVKELVIAGMLVASRDIIGGINWVESQKDNADIAKAVEANKSQFAGNEVRGKKLGIIGLGAIGIKVANTASHLGMEVYGYDPYISVDAAWRLSRNIKHIKSVEEIYSECDYITMHVPLLEETKEMINKDSLAMMKDGVVILNFSRDLLVNDEDMLAALTTSKVKKYVTDFPNSKVAGQKGVIAIPHLGASTEESEDNCAIMAVAEIMDYIDNGNIKNSVNFPDCDMGICKGEGRISILHLNIPNMIGQITGGLAAAGANISDMTNKSKGKFAYTLLDLECKVTPAMVEALNKIQGILKIRVVK